MYFYESCRENILKLTNSEISEVTYTIRETNQESTRKNRVFFLPCHTIHALVISIVSLRKCISK